VKLFQLTVDQYFVYRLNFVLWRFRVVLNLLMIYFLWSAIYVKNKHILGYTEDMMITYVLLISILSDFVFSSRVHEVGAEILTGDIINRILKPISFFKYLLTKELADKAINVSFAIIEITVLILLTHPSLVPPQSTEAFIVAIFQLCIGLILSFWMSFCIAMIAFWTAEIWAPRFIYFILVFVLAGNYFPLDILPAIFYKLLLLTPFPYFIFVPAQTYLKGIPENVLLQFIISILWIGITYKGAYYLWKKGMKEYSFYGR
jgi:ABC-2 type transport system permease protein